MYIEREVLFHGEQSFIDFASLFNWQMINMDQQKAKVR